MKTGSLISFILLISIGTSASCMKKPSGYTGKISYGKSWVLKEKIRCLSYIDISRSDAEIKRTKELGFNSVLFVNTNQDIKSALPVLNAAKKYGVHVFWVDCLRTKFGQRPLPEELKDDSVRFVGEDGRKFADQPCPFDSVYWNVLLGSRSIELAKLAQQGNSFIGGMLIDLEDYDGSRLWDQYCFCSECFKGFLQSISFPLSNVPEIPAGQRKDWLQSHNLLEQFQKYEHNRLQKILKDIRRKVDEYDPQFLFAAYPWPANMYSKDMVLSLGCNETPFVFFSELSYGGYQPYFENELGKSLEDSLPEIVVSGFEADSSQHFTPGEIVPNIYYGSLSSAGYWVYVGSWPLLDAALGYIHDKPFLGTTKDWTKEITIVNKKIENLKDNPGISFPYPLLNVQEEDQLQILSRKDVIEVSSKAAAADVKWKDEGLPWKGSEVILKLNHPNAYMNFSINVPEKNRYRILADITRGPNRGIVKLSIDGKELNKTFDSYFPVLTPGVPVDLGEVVLNSGQHKFQFNAVGKSEKSKGYEIGLRGIILVPEGLSPFPKEWNIVGPFDNSSDNGFYTIYPPEKELNFNVEYQGKDGVTAKWKKVLTDSTGYLPLHQYFSQKNYVLAYAQTYVYTPADTTGFILLGTDDGGKLWVNHQLVWAMNTHRSAVPDEDRLIVHLNKGWNSILVKVTQAQWDWGMFMRLQNDEGRFKYSTSVTSN